MIDNPTKITYVTSIPAPYKTPRLNALAARDDVDLQIHYASRRTHRHDYSHIPERHFDWNVFRAFRLQLGKSEIMLNLDSAPKLLFTDADALITGGWNYTAAWEVLITSKLRGIPAALLSENLEQRTRIADVVASRFVPQFDAFFAASTGAKENFVRLGAEEEDVTVLPYCIDVDAFQSNINNEEIEAIRNRYDITADHIVLYVGRLSDRKGVDDLLTAAAEFDIEKTHLLIVGDGPKHQALETQAQVLDIPVTFTGAVPNQLLANYYSLASVFVLPTRAEPWGLVQNEALACGTPVVTTTASGAVGDLILNGQNALVVEPDTPEALRDAVTTLLNDPDLREKMSQNGLERSKEFTPNTYADAMKSTVDEMLS
jgi:glycosyltransferase involved in cell wall biosynthesis